MIFFSSACYRNLAYCYTLEVLKPDMIYKSIAMNVRQTPWLSVIALVTAISSRFRLLCETLIETIFMLRLPFKAHVLVCN